MTEQPFHDELVQPDATGLPDRFFDRFMFNLHPADASRPSVIMGCGLYPPRNVIDGFVVVSTQAEQRNARFSTELSATNGRSVGPLSFETVTPNEKWRLRLGPNPTGLELDVTWRARTPHWWAPMTVTTTTGETTSFEHLVQSGRYAGTLTLDGQAGTVDGWWGQRDRSRGVRTMAGGQGIHIWFQAQFPDRTVNVTTVDDRQGGRIMLEGAVMHEDGTIDAVTDFRHDLQVTEGLDIASGTVLVATESGRHYRIGCDLGAGGGLMAGGGYGGHHGKLRGRDHLESDVYPLDGSVTPRSLDSSLTDRLTRFDWDGTAGSGIFEFALSRSGSYTYVPTLG